MLLNKTKIRNGIVLALLCAAQAGSFLRAQQVDELTADIDTLNAAASLRIGLEAYNRYAFNESILALEQALSYKPGEGLILDWLGRAYYRSGFEEIALRQWQAAARSYPTASPEAVILNSRVELVQSRRSLLWTLNDSPRYVEAGSFYGAYQKTNIFSQPSSVLACSDGTSWVVAYGSNELVRLDVNGLVRVRRRGPLAGFDRPYDITRGLDGRLYVSEFRGGRISVLSENGEWLAYIGKKGINDGELVGPAALACDESGYIYAVEFGNKRISKFDPDGNFILSFGKRDGSFSGFVLPTGIAARGGVIYVADGISKQIYMFNSDGNYLGTAIESGLNAPESLKIFPDGSLLIADTNRLLAADPNSGIVRELTSAGNSRIRYIGAELDRNGSILAANFSENEVDVLAPVSSLVSGLFVQVDRILSADFPNISIELSVRDSKRRPLVGLDFNNFVLSERGYPVENQQLLGSGNAARNVDISILLERSLEAASLQNDFIAAIEDINKAMRESGGNIASVISAEARPERRRFNQSSAQSLAAAVNSGGYSMEWRFDLGLRLAVTDLIPLSKKRAVVFVSTGELGGLAFEQYGLSELVSYMANNNVAFYCVLAGGKPPRDVIKYLCKETGGESLVLFSPRGIGAALKSIVEDASGSYALSYKSRLASDFGRAFLPLTAEVHILEMSGRDEAGYFPPLE